MLLFGALSAPLVLTSCADDNNGNDPVNPPSGEVSGVFIVNEGVFTNGDASLSWYDIEAKTVENHVYDRTNGEPLGDVAQSMTIHGGKGYVVVNNSHIIKIIDPKTFEIRGTIPADPSDKTANALVSPRYIHFVGDTKAYVTQMYDPRIAIVDPATRKVAGYIDMTGHVEDALATQASVDQMVQVGDLVFANCWSYNNRIIVIDTETDEIVNDIEVGIQPASMVLTDNGKIWVVTDGGYDGNPLGSEAPALYRIDAATQKVEKEIAFDKVGFSFVLASDGGNVYLLNGGVWKFDADADAESLPEEPFITSESYALYDIAVDPSSGELYVADAVDFKQSGTVYRYSPTGELVDEFEVGISPGYFCFFNE